MQFMNYQALPSGDLCLESAETERVAGEAASRSLAFSRRPLFHTFSFLSKTDTNALLEEKDESRAAQRLNELLHLESFVQELRRPGPTRQDSFPPDFGSFAQLQTPRDSATSPLSDDFLEEPFRTPVSTHCQDENQQQEDAELRSSETPLQPDLQEVLEETVESSKVGLDPKDPDSQREEEEFGDEAFTATLHLFMSALKFCKNQSFSPKATSAFLSLLRAVYGRAIGENLDPDAAFDAFKTEIIRHSVQRPPVSCEVFAYAQLLPATDFFLTQVVAFLRPLQRLHGRPAPAPPSRVESLGKEEDLEATEMQMCEGSVPLMPSERAPEVKSSDFKIQHASPRRSHHPARR